MALLLKCCNLGAYVADMALNAKFGKGIKDLSGVYDHVAMPAGAAFSIWGIIFTWELVFVVAQFFMTGFDDILPKLTCWFCATQLMQGLWVPLFTQSNPESVTSGGDAWFWVSTLLLIVTPAAFLKLVAALADLSGAAYWVSFGMTVNAAWVLMAAGLTVNMAARAVGLEGAPLSAVALVVLAGTVCLELWITGFVGDNHWKSPAAFFPVATWALLWIFSNLRTVASGSDDHAKRILPLYGSSFAVFFKWCALTLAVLFVVLEVALCISMTSRKANHVKQDFTALQ
mmetsp:Transcript_84305/g.161184  ORF Transcript_84305/g.161184 Transcript_84305/m.161184 type:complete len:286 (+) Transcript_84305:48-905(+)